MAQRIPINNIKTMVLKDFGDVKLALEAMAGQGLVKRDIDTILINAAQPLIDEMKARVPVDTGRLRNSITVWSARKNPYRVYVGPSYKLGGGGRVAHILEYGTVERVMTKGLRAGGITQSTMERFKGPSEFAPYKGKSTGVVMARPFIRPAVEAASDLVIRNLQHNILVNLATRAKKLGFKVA